MREQYPEAPAYETGTLDVGDGHQLYYERHGHPRGKPVIYLHGGPGGGCSFNEYRWFHPDHFDVLIFDQRGSGKSTPYAGTQGNSIAALVADIEKLRQHLFIDKWNICGGSWGSALAMSYAAAHPERVERMLLRGIFFADRKGAQHIITASHLKDDKKTEFYRDYVDFIPPEERKRDGLLKAYYNRVMSPDQALAVEAARRFYIWDTAIATKHLRQDWIDEANKDPESTLALSRLFFHFASHEFKDSHKKHLLEAMADLDIPVDIIHGADDKICPVENARELHKICQNSTLATPPCGHSQREPELLEAFLDITDRWMSDDLVRTISFGFPDKPKLN